MICIVWKVEFGKVEHNLCFLREMAKENENCLTKKANEKQNVNESYSRLEKLFPLMGIFRSIPM
ncbi:unnamed protein product [Arabidopsis halleri]